MNKFKIIVKLIDIFNKYAKVVLRKLNKIIKLKIKASIHLISNYIISLRLHWAYCL